MTSIQEQLERTRPVADRAAATVPDSRSRFISLRSSDGKPDGVLAHAHVMKTAGQTICDILRQSFPGDHCDLQGRHVATMADLRLAARFYPRLKSIASHCVVPAGDLAAVGDWFRFFTFLRDPVRRCASHYQFVRRRTKTSLDFDTWLEDNANYQTRFFAREANADQAIEVLDGLVGFVGLVERFNESLLLLRRWSREPALDIHYRSRNMAKDNRIKKELLADPQVVAKIREHHAEDYKLYGYVCDVVYPRQVRQYGPLLEADMAALESRLPARRTASLARTLASAKRNLLYKPIARRLIKRRAAVPRGD